jgi:hypothetical protein
MTAVIPVVRAARYGRFMRAAILHPARPERVCWGCEKFCPAHDLACGNGTIRTPHPSELFGDDWLEWSEGPEKASSSTAAPVATDGEKARTT